MQNSLLMFTLIMPPVSLRCAYAFALADNTVKIGSTGNVYARKVKLQTTLGVKVVVTHNTDFMPLNKAVEIERACLKTFTDFKVHGEIFNVNFDRVKAELDSYSADIAEYNRTFLQTHLSVIQSNHAALGRIIDALVLEPIAPANADIDNWTRIDYRGERVMTTAQLAKAYICSPRNISDNFNNNIGKFREGEHYIKLDGVKLQEFKRYSDNIGLAVNKFSAALYLWTYFGVVRHCILINTPEAWNMFKKLEDAYFNRQTPDETPADHGVDKISLLRNLLDISVNDDDFRAVAKAILCQTRHAVGRAIL